MIFEDLEALQKWLVVDLEPLCDAEPEALTKYVIALLKKDKPEDILRESMKQQLQIFLQHETDAFLDRLFSCVKSGDYKKCDESVSEGTEVKGGNVSPGQETAISPVKLDGEKKCQRDVRTNDNYKIGDGYVKGANSEVEHLDDYSTSKNLDAGSERPNWRENRSRSVSMETSPRRKRSFIGKIRSGHVPRHNRYSPIRRRTRREAPFSRRLRSRSPVMSRFGPKRIAGSDRSRSKSWSPVRQRRPNPPSPSESDSLLDNISNNCSVRSVVVKAEDPGKTVLADGSLNHKRRCLDYDEQGVCMLGERCPFDHGSDPVIFSDVLNRDGNSNLEKPPSTEYFPESPAIIGAPPKPFLGWGHGLPRRQLRPKHSYPEPFLHRGNMARHGMMRHLGPSMIHPQRHLITVPVTSHMLHGHMPPVGFLPENPFALPGSRLNVRPTFAVRGRGRGSLGHGFISQRQPKLDGNRCLAVRKIPKELNKIGALISHFSRFGNVVTIQVAFDGDPEGALVIFESHQDAFQAYRSTEAVLNNRFIKVFWHAQEPDPNAVPLANAASAECDKNFPESEPRGNINQSRDACNNDEASRLKQTFLALSQDTKTESKTEDGAKVVGQSTVRCTTHVVEAPAKRLHKKTSSETSAVDVRKQEMVSRLNSHIQEQKQLISKFEAERNRMTPKQKDEVLQLLKNLQHTCEQLKSEIACATKSSSGEKADGQLVSKSKDEIRRKKLDEELAEYMGIRKASDTVATKAISD